ncbi:MAG: hypothetical protein NVSMB49_14420 [Ktedonobacteraceae bacterium]
MNFYHIGGIHLVYQIDGRDDAPTLVFVNSVGTDLRMWDPQIALLSPSMRVIRYDCRGHGASDVPDGPYTILILAGELDESTPPSQSRELYAAIAGSQLGVFRDVSHLSNIERPAEFSQYIQTFLTHT